MTSGSRIGRRLIAGLPLALVLADAAGACGTPTGASGPPLVVGSNPFPGIQPAPPGLQRGVIGVPVDVFAPSTPMSCVCGLGAGATGSPAPPSFAVDQAVLTRYDPATGQHTILTEFVPLALSSVTSSALLTGPGQPLAGSHWFGFSGLIQPFTTPALRPGEIFLLNFAVSFDPEEGDLLAGLPIQFAAGGGDSGGLPLFDDREEHPTHYFGPAVLPPCLPTQNVLCLHDGRFEVEITWKDFDLRTGRGIVAPCPTRESGNFAFFNGSNLEMLFKVLDGCGLNNRYWVFFAPTTNVEFVVVVTDTKVPLSKAYRNPLGKPAAPVQDTSAFATCP